VLLAHSTKSFQEQVLAGELFRYTEQTVQSPEALRRLLQKIRHDGFAIGNGFIHPDARGVAVPVRGVNDTIVAGLSVVVPNDDAPTIPLVRLLQTASTAITKDLLAAYTPPNDPQSAPGGHFRQLVSSSADSMEYLPTAPRPARAGR
jgi:DNA-binding IclR family transcriptional regulator